MPCVERLWGFAGLVAAILGIRAATTRRDMESVSKIGVLYCPLQYSFGAYHKTTLERTASQQNEESDGCSDAFWEQLPQSGGASPRTFIVVITVF